MLNYDNFINGKFAPATGNGKMTVINPSDGKPVCTVPDSTAADVDAAVAAAVVAQKEWAKRPAIQRARYCTLLRTRSADRLNRLRG